jgi:FkbM family methyltransferase
VVVEPLPDLFDRLVANYAGLPDMRFANLAIARGEGPVTMYTVGPRPDDPDWGDQIGSLYREVVLRHTYALPDLERRIVEVEVDAVSLEALIAQYDIQRIDVLHVDAEGSDHEIIGQLDLDAAWAPRYLVFEAKHMSEDVFSATRSRLMGAGYRIVNLWPDQLAYRLTPQ